MGPEFSQLSRRPKSSATSLAAASSPSGSGSAETSSSSCSSATTSTSLVVRDTNPSAISAEPPTTTIVCASPRAASCSESATKSCSACLASLIETSDITDQDVRHPRSVRLITATGDALRRRGERTCLLGTPAKTGRSGQVANHQAKLDALVELSWNRQVSRHDAKQWRQSGEREVFAQRSARYPDSSRFACLWFHSVDYEFQAADFDGLKDSPRCD